jgi:hypothetical protein
MSKKEPYTCPRCQYFTSRKANMRKHLYGAKKSCPASTVDIELTDTIKNYILDNRIYHPPKQTQQQIINQQINNNNTIINFVNKMDFQDKLVQYLGYLDTDLLEYQDTIETKYEKQVDRLEKKSKGFQKYDTLSLDGLINVLHTCTTTNDVQEMNVMYDKVLNRLHIYGGEWEPYLFKEGVKELIEKIQEVYLDYYEEYLLRQYSVGSVFDKQCIKEALKEYYEFLECFHVDPRLTTSPEDWVQDLCDGDIGRLHIKVKDELRASKLREVKKTVYDVIKTNCTASVLELNKKIVDLIKMDEMFKNKVLVELQGVQTE